MARELQDKKITVRLTKTVHEELKNIAQRQHISMAECFRLLLADKLTNQKSINLSDKSRVELLQSITNFWTAENELISNYQRTTNNINQIAKDSNLGISVDVYQEDISRDLVSLKEMNQKTQSMIIALDKEMTKLWQQLE